MLRKNLIANRGEIACFADAGDEVLRLLGHDRLPPGEELSEAAE